MLKFKVESLDEVEEKYRDLYEEKTVGGKKVFFLKVEGVVAPEKLADANKKLKDFRDKNILLANRLKLVVERVGVEIEEGGEDNVEALSDEDLAEKIEAKLKERSSGGKNDDDIAKLVDAKVGQFRKQQEDLLKKTIKERDEALAKATKAQVGYEKVTIETQVLGAALKRGLKATAQADILNRARQRFKMVDGKLTALDDDGETELMGADGNTGLTVEEWVESQAAKEASHLFESNSGGGASGGSGGAGRLSGARGPNPWKAETWNITKQMELQRKDPATAKRLADEAGVKLPV